MLNAIDNAVITTDVAGKITYWSEAAEKLYGWSRAEVVGRDIVDVVPADVSRATASSIMQTLAAGEIWSGVFPVRDRDGREFHAAVTDLPIIKGGEVIGIVGVSNPDEHASSLATLLANFIRSAGLLWPGQIEDDVRDGLESAIVAVGDPHVLQLLALLLIRDVAVLERGETLRIFATRSTKDLLAQFDVSMSAANSAYIRLGRSGDSTGGGSVLREAMRTTEESRYAAMLVSRAGGRLFTGAAPSQQTAAHLFLPVGI